MAIRVLNQATGFAWQSRRAWNSLALKPSRHCSARRRLEFADGNSAMIFAVFATPADGCCALFWNAAF
jgi:hypothetical protein